MYPGKQCGGCTACCKLVSVPELKKPACRDCDHARKGVGCAIYQDRPPSCQQWECVWLKAPSHLMGDEFRPDRCHVVLEENHQGLMARCDPDWPDAWRSGVIAEVLQIHARRGNPVYMMCGHQLYVIGTNGAFTVPPSWVIDSGDGMRQRFTIPTEVLRQIGWGPMKFLDKMRRRWQ
jgi:hypothetical protein